MLLVFLRLAIQISHQLQGDVVDGEDGREDSFSDFSFLDSPFEVVDDPRVLAFDYAALRFRPRLVHVVRFAFVRLGHRLKNNA